MPKILISLISRQPMPNYIGAKMIEPDKMIYLFTPQEKTTMERLQKVLQLPNEILEVNAFDYESVREAFFKVIQTYSDHEIILNVTGGTKIMALSAFDIAREYNFLTIYVNTFENEIIRFQNGRIETQNLPEVVDIPTYLNLHGHYYLEEGELLYPELAKFIGRNFKTLKSILLHLRGIEPHKPYRLPGMISSQQRELLKRLEKMRLIKYIPVKTQLICKTTENLPFIKGGWLEEFIYQKLKEGNPYDIRLNVKISWRPETSVTNETKNEFDVMLIHRNQLHIFECKSGKKNIKDIHKLEALREIVGGTYGKGYYVFTGKLDKTIQERLNDFSELKLLNNQEILSISEYVFQNNV